MSVDRKSPVGNTPLGASAVGASGRGELGEGYTASSRRRVSKQRRPGFPAHRCRAYPVRSRVSAAPVVVIPGSAVGSGLSVTVGAMMVTARQALATPWG